MAKKKTTTIAPGTDDHPRVAHEVYDTTIDSFIAQKVVPYFVYTVTDRAVPSVVDGLKKGQRRLLYSAYESGITPDSKPRKSARVISDATGKYHPHGQTAMYDTLSTLAHTYGRLPLIQGLGSFGMNPGDPAASERYTEARLSEAGMEVVRDMRDEPVTMLRTFDGMNREPQYLPSRFPVAPLAGSDGIAAGFSVTIPSHNPIEFLKLTRALLANPDLTTEEMMEIMPGPDWGVGASVINSKKAIASYFDNGTGKLTARSTFENIDGDVVLKEIAPTGSGLRKTLGQIRDKIRAGEITTLSGAEDHSDMDKGTHVVFTLRRGKKYEDAVAELYSKTSLEDTYSVNMVFTDRDDIPRTWGIREVIAQFLTLRDEVLVARSTAALNAATTKLQRAEAVKAVVLDKDTAVRLITESADRAAADAALSKAFDLDEEQAHYVTSLALYRLTKADVLDAQREVDQLTAEIERLRALIDSEDLRAEELDKELEESINVFVRDGRYDRKTRIDHDAKPTSAVASDGDEPRLSAWKLDKDLGLVTDTGETIKDGEVVWAVFADGRVKLFSGDGLPKRMNPTPIAPDVSDLVACGTLTPGTQRLFLVASHGKALALDTTAIRPQGKAARGVAGMKMPEDTQVIAGFAAGAGDIMVTQSIDGWKATACDEVNTKGRGAGGVVVHKLRKGDTAVVSAVCSAKPTANGEEVKPTAPARATNHGTIDLDQ